MSRVAPNTPADQAAPRLREGDEVVAINGHEVRGLTHEQVVKLIRASWIDDPQSKQTASMGITQSGDLNQENCERSLRKKDKRRPQSGPQSTQQGELVLMVRPQAFVLRRGGADTDQESEPDFQYIPLSSDDLESPRIANTVSAALRDSMLLLKEGLLSGALVAQFDQLYRKKPGMACDISKLAVNAHRNRYKDISPCE